MQLTAEKLKEMMASIDWDIDPAVLDPSLPLRDQGLDSLDMITLFFFLEERLAVKIPETDSSSLHTLNDILGYLARK